DDSVWDRGLVVRAVRCRLRRYGYGVVHEVLYNGRARHQERRRQRYPGLFDPPRLAEEAEKLRVGEDLGAAQLQGLAVEVGATDRLHDAAGGVLPDDRLQVLLAAAGDDDDRPQVDGSLEVVDHASVLAQDEAEAEDDVGSARPLEGLLPGPAGHQVLVLG